MEEGIREIANNNVRHDIEALSHAIKKMRRARLNLIRSIRKTSFPEDSGVVPESVPLTMEIKVSKQLRTLLEDAQALTYENDLEELFKLGLQELVDAKLDQMVCKT